jgi:hypothetical protein
MRFDVRSRLTRLRLGIPSPNLRNSLLCLLAAATTAIGYDLTRFRVSGTEYSRQDLSLVSGMDASVAGEPAGQYFNISLAPGYSYQFDSRSESRNLFYGTGTAGYFWHQSRSNQAALSARAYVGLETFLPRSDFFLGPSFDCSVEPVYQDQTTDSVLWRQFELRAGATPGFEFGIGRVRDAWPLLKAQRIAQILAAESVLTRGLTDDELLELSRFVSRAWRLFKLHDRPARFYYDSLEFQLRRLRAISAPLPAWVLMRLDEDLAVGDYRREFGLRFVLKGEAKLSGQYTTYFRPEIVPSKHGDVVFGTAAEFSIARPFGLRWVTSAGITYHPTFYEIDEVGHTAEAKLAASYQLLDRLQVGLNQGLSLKTKPHAVRAEFRSTTGLDFVFYIEERLNVSAGIDAWLENANKGISLTAAFGYGRTW